jgi:hypothetical protein
VLDRLGAFLERPLAGRAMLAAAAAILLGFATLFALAVGETPRRAVPREPAGSSAARRRAPSPRPPEDAGHQGGARTRSFPRRDPQGESGAARRAARALRTHRALQHLPYSHGGVAIRIAGARGGRAVLAVSAPTPAAARRGWRAFLRRYRDSGRGYVPRFGARRSGLGGGA